jgi:hypothetical protein
MGIHFRRFVGHCPLLFLTGTVVLLELKLEGVAEVDIDSGRINARAVYTVVAV